MMSRYLLIVTAFFIANCSSSPNNTIINETSSNSQPYFPSSDSEEWATVSPDELGWNTNQLQPLIDFLTIKNTKGFIILYQGKLAVEVYMNGHNATSNWYWASAGKTLTSTTVGIAQAEGLLDINNKVSDYLGIGWTSTPIDKENLITSKHLLSMTSGLDDSLGDNVTPNHLQYSEDAGLRWAYHNVYIKLQDVVTQASNTSWQTYFTSKLKDKIGMSGAWLPLDATNVYWSTTRSMARFGLLIAAGGRWNSTQIVPENFLLNATSTSQTINEAYGYLWWLNGKSTYHLPLTQVTFSGQLIPNAPDDMYAALGKNDQKIYIVPSKNLVIVRMGDAAESSNFALSRFDNDLWTKIKALTN